jgi:hypothetical protein
MAEAGPDLLLDLSQLIGLSSNFWQHNRRRNTSAAKIKLELTPGEPRHDLIAAHILRILL